MRVCALSRVGDLVVVCAVLALLGLCGYCEHLLGCSSTAVRTTTVGAWPLMPMAGTAGLDAAEMLRLEHLDPGWDQPGDVAPEAGLWQTCADEYGKFLLMERGADTVAGLHQNGVRETGDT